MSQYNIYHHTPKSLCNCTFGRNVYKLTSVVNTVGRILTCRHRFELQIRSCEKFKICTLCPFLWYFIFNLEEEKPTSSRIECHKQGVVTNMLCTVGGVGL